MREVKFRAWSILDKYFCSQSWLVGNWYFVLHDKNTILQQYTGLKDKNGVEIYEGDIVTDGYSNNGEVIYNQDCCQFLVNMGEGIDLQEIGDWCEVIGNIYENPELLS